MEREKVKERKICFQLPASSAHTAISSKRRYLDIPTLEERIIYHEYPLTAFQGVSNCVGLFGKLTLAVDRRRSEKEQEKEGTTCGVALIYLLSDSPVAVDRRRSEKEGTTCGVALICFPALLACMPSTVSNIPTLHCAAN